MILILWLTMKELTPQIRRVYTALLPSSVACPAKAHTVHVNRPTYMCEMQPDTPSLQMQAWPPPTSQDARVSPPKVRMSEASPLKSHLWVTELAFLPAFRQLKLVCSLFRNCPMVISYSYPHRLAKSPKMETTRLSLLLHSEPSQSLASSRHGKCPWVSTSLPLLLPQVNRWGLLYSPIYMASILGLGWGAQHYPIPKPLNYS